MIVPTVRHRTAPDTPLSWAGRAMACALAFALLAMGALAASPHAHEGLHHDAGQPDHVCAVTLATAGFCDTSAHAPGVAPASNPAAVLFVAAQRFTWSTPRFWHAFAQAPPRVAN
jgi:hypothetical protein